MLPYSEEAVATMKLLELPLEAIRWDSSEVHFERSRFIRSHLRYILDRQTTWPVVPVVWDDDGFVAQGGYPYLEIARDLSRETVRALLLPGKKRFHLRSALSSVGGKELEISGELEELMQDSFVGEHVLFFKDTLSDNQRNKFSERIKAVFPSNKTDTSFDLNGKVATVRGTRAAEDPQFAARLFSEMLTFHREVCPILSYQGRRFPPEE